MATLKDIADRVGVSVATVSYCINNTKTVKASTRDRIMQAIRELNYIPNDAARKLKKVTARELAVVFPDIDDLCRSEILKGLISGAEDADRFLDIAFSYNSPKLERSIIDRFIGKNVAGLILITCQPGNTEYFKNTIVRNNIPTVFIDRFPENIDANFLSFDNYQACNYLTRQLIERRYTDILLMSGFHHLFSEHECIRGFTDAMEESNLPCPPEYVLETELTKESAFRETMFHVAGRPPQAIIASSELLAKGIMEALNLSGVQVPRQTCVITLGEDCWNSTNYLPNVIHTARAAYTLGKRSIESLMKNLRSPKFFEKEFMLLKDSVVDASLKLPAPCKTPYAPRAPRRQLRILSPVLSTTEALRAVSAQFEREHDVKISIDITSYHELFDAIVENARGGNGGYDIYFFDTSWSAYLSQIDAFADLTEFIKSQDVFRQCLISKNLGNCLNDDRYVGFPIVGGSHILFYRRDLFDDPMIRRQFEALYNEPLQVPRTWTEFNGIARFFTKEFNPYSPTAFGTSVIGSIHEELALEILIRLWSFGGNILDESGRLCLDSPQNIKGFQSLLESCRYAEKNVFEASIEKSFDAFGTGRTAMLLSFTEYASAISDRIHGDIISRVDYAMMPGKTPANVGWNLGVNKKTKHSELITDYFAWMCKKHTSYYMTTLNGQSVIRHPYENHELMKLYPWMSLVAEGQRNARDRVYPMFGRSGLVPPHEVETVLYKLFHKMYHQQATVPDALREGQKLLADLFQWS